MILEILRFKADDLLLNIAQIPRTWSDVAEIPGQAARDIGRS